MRLHLAGAFQEMLADNDTTVSPPPGGGVDCQSCLAKHFQSLKLHFSKAMFLIVIMRPKPRTDLPYLPAGCLGKSKASSRHDSPRTLTTSSGALETLPKLENQHCEVSECIGDASGLNSVMSVEKARKIAAVG